jgi:hypothetical protein
MQNNLSTVNLGSGLFKVRELLKALGKVLLIEP